MTAHKHVLYVQPPDVGQAAGLRVMVSGGADRSRFQFIHHSVEMALQKGVIPLCGIKETPERIQHCQSLLLKGVDFGGEDRIKHHRFYHIRIVFHHLHGQTRSIGGAVDIDLFVPQDSRQILDVRRILKGVICGKINALILEPFIAL